MLAIVDVAVLVLVTVRVPVLLTICVSAVNVGVANASDGRDAAVDGENNEDGRDGGVATWE